MSSSPGAPSWPEPRRIVGNPDIEVFSGLGAANGASNCAGHHPGAGRNNSDGPSGIDSAGMRAKYPFLTLGHKPRTALTSEEAVRGLRRVTGEDGEVHGQGSKGCGFFFLRRGSVHIDQYDGR